jgi:hypothetical protein
LYDASAPPFHQSFTITIDLHSHRQAIKKMASETAILSTILLVLLKIQSGQCFQRNHVLTTPLRPSPALSIRQPFSLFVQDSENKKFETDSSSSADVYGFDKPATPISQSPPPPQQSDRLRKSLDESAKFKIRNDARFTWLSTLLVSGAYAYGCLAPDGQEFLEILGIPNGGIVGGLAGIAFSLLSILLFFAPELFASKEK